jgi:thiol-disulfide isomerase/thioredoxin
MAAEMKAITARLTVTEQRTGLKPVSGSWLKTMPAGNRFEAGDAVYVAGHGRRGKRRNLAKYVRSYKAHVAVIWATWCKPCTSAEELELLHRLQPQLKRRGVELVSVLVDDLSIATGHAKAPQWIYPLWFGKDAQYNWLPKKLASKLDLPLFLVVGPDLGVRYYAMGKLDEARLRALVTAAAF